MGQEKSRMSCVPFVFAGIIFISFIGLFIYVLISGISETRSSIQRFQVPGSAVLEIKEVGTYSLFHEYASVYEGKEYYVNNLPSFNLAIRPLGSTREIETTPLAGVMTYNFGSIQGRAIRNFEITQPGQYEFTFTYQDRSPTPKTIMAISSDLVYRILKTIFLCLVLMSIGIFLPIAIIVIYLVKHHMSNLKTDFQPGFNSGQYLDDEIISPNDYD
jgi:hypothetical protein